MAGGGLQRGQSIACGMAAVAGRGSYGASMLTSLRDELEITIASGTDVLAPAEVRDFNLALSRARTRHKQTVALFDRDVMQMVRITAPNRRSSFSSFSEANWILSHRVSMVA